MSADQTLLDPADAFLKTDFAKELTRQMRAVDTYGVLDRESDAMVLDPFILSKERKREIPVVGDPDEETIARVKAYYNALAVMIEARTGFMAAPLVNLTYEGFGRALITVGKLIVMDKAVRDIHRFGFASAEKLQSEAAAIVDRAVALVEAHRDVAAL